MVKTYSEFINYPIYLYVSKEVEEKVEKKDEEVKESLPSELENVKDEEKEKENEEKKEEEKKEETKKKTVFEWEIINDTKAIWLKPIEDIEDNEYKKFYRNLTKDFMDPMTWIHFKAEGEVEFTSLLYIPKSAPPNYIQSD